jgi:hypothetical protein
VLLLDLTNRRAARRTFLVLVTCVCLFAVVFAATAEAQHIHAARSHNDAQRCTVCAAAHSPTLLATVAILSPQMTAAPLRLVLKVSASPALSLEADFIRPPPAPLA